ncbi:hypothetical protein NQ315_006833 [Exocentrus adspersus]|uniref:Uncharacterized protein n=1 Tax=Exocentrus adspersus TaxID=1586481 RepID=A0AAV8WEF5_9CUCU|nr:hypothetical protein NQ315_006833 [Exocentrus adspersus]
MIDILYPRTLKLVVHQPQDLWHQQYLTLHTHHTINQASQLHIQLLEVRFLFRLLLAELCTHLQDQLRILAGQEIIMLTPLLMM